MNDTSEGTSATTRRTVLRRGAGIAAGLASVLSVTAFTAPGAEGRPAQEAGDASGTGGASKAGAASGSGGAEGRPGGGLPATVAGIRVPDTRLARAAVAFARRACPETLFNHLMRTYLFGALLFERRGVRYDRELVFVAALLHDLGLLEEFRTPTERFEVDGADAAQRFLEQQDVAAPRVAVVWDAIALHTSVGIATRKRPEIAMVCVGSGLDFTGNGLERIPPDALAEVLSAFPRAGFKEAALGDILTLCRTKPMAEVMHPFAEVGRRHLPDFRVPTVEDLLLAAPFED
ncbi:HD domain-containing protein [Kitasatospora sp. NPDC001539]|uniref:HD domain-containing protein n=1 Tax=Kitasatospora sp. NPDC001539 TaxID=3154384 RepID=UPI00332AFA8F